MYRESEACFPVALQMFLDDLPIWGFVGKVEKILHAGEVTHYKQFLFTHIHFDIRYNGALPASFCSQHHQMISHSAFTMSTYCTMYQRQSIWDCQTKGLFHTKTERTIQSHERSIQSHEL